MSYRITTHKGRTTKNGNIAYSAKHLDRKFDLRKAPHIDPSRCHLNRYVEFDVDSDGALHHRRSKDIQGHEIVVYKKLFQDRLDAQNARYIAQRHAEKCKTLKQYYSAPQTCPDEYLIYIGNRDDHPPSDILMGAASELITRIQRKYANNFIPLSICVHLDESGAPHLHFRNIWVCNDKNGPKVSITQGMKAAGIEPPQSDKSEQKYNNRQMAFSEEFRETFADICEQMYGLEIEREARDSSKSGKDLTTFQRDKAAEEAQKLAQECANLKEEKTILTRAVDRLKRILTPLQRLYHRLTGIRTVEGKTALEELTEDTQAVEDLRFLHEDER